MEDRATALSEMKITCSEFLGMAPMTEESGRVLVPIILRDVMYHLGRYDYFSDDLPLD
jgi:hypothetical protein